MAIDMPGRMPMYLEVAAALRGGIASGLYAPGDRLPSETQLMRRHHVSRAVAKTAVAMLKHDGLVDGRQGSGVFVRQTLRLVRKVGGIGTPLSELGRLETECFGGGVLDHDTYRHQVVEAEGSVAQRLAITPGLPVTQISARYLRADGRPLQLVTSWQLGEAPGNGEPDVWRPDHHEERVSWRAAGSQEIDSLGLRWQGSVQAITRTFSRQGVPLITADIVIPSDVCELVYQVAVPAK
jgi:hypothetical protein